MKPKAFRAVLRAFLVFCGVIVLSSCRSPQRLLEKAIQKDPDIISQYSDTITITRHQIDSVLVEVGDTVIWEKVVTVTEFDTIIPVRLIEIEKAKTRQEVRKAHRLEMAILKMQDREAAYKFKLTELQAKLDARTDRLEVRHETKVVRSKSRWWLWLVIGVVSGILGTLMLDRLWTKFWRL